MDSWHRSIRAVLFAFTAIALCSCASTSRYGERSIGTPVAPGSLLAGDVLDIRAPNSNGWLLLASNPDGVAFGKHAAEPGETYAAEVERFDPPKSEKPEAFVAFVKESVAKGTNPDRFDVLSLDIKRSDSRPYPCVSVEYTALDKKARTSPNATEQLLLQAISLYCRHPSRPDVGFAIIFSHRGSALDPGIRQPAEDFIANVVVPAR